MWKRIVRELKKNMHVKCKLCGTIIKRISTYALLSHLMEHHTIQEFETNKRLVDYYQVTDHSTLELIEFMCPRCYKRKDSFNRTCYMDREAFETKQAIPYCGWCLEPMELRRNKDKDRYGR